MALAAGVAAGSVALVGFGFDSTIEVLSAWVVVWQFQAELRGGYDEERERRALRLIGVTFFVRPPASASRPSRSVLHRH